MSTHEGIPKSPYEDPQVEQFGMPRQQTRCKVIVHSHIINNDLQGEVDCTDDVIACNTSKSIKGGGGAQFILVARRNYVNYIFPNDWVNIYFDVGDGRGWTRTFFGFVDRCSRSIQTGEEGQTDTRYTVICSDFTKAFDKTQIYFNPHIAKREDFVGKFSNNLAGAQLRTKGVTVFGSPADIVMNLTQLLLGNNSQFLMPPRYPVDNAILETSYSFRRKWIIERLGFEARDAIGKDTVAEWLRKLELEAKPVAEELKKGDPNYINQVSMTIALQEEVNPSLEGPPDVRGAAAKRATRFQELMWTPGKLGEVEARADVLALKYRLALKKKNPDLINKPDIQSALTLEATLVDRHSLVDMIDFSFVEYGAIDGSLVSTAIWTQQGTLWSIINSHSNGIINELFLDLRPLGTRYRDYGLMKGGYSREPDEHHGRLNLGEVGDSHDHVTTMDPVRFVPAMIMREYPFSTIDSIDAHKVSILKTSPNAIELGAIWSQGVNTPGRHVYELQVPINDYEITLSPNKKAYKHLDVHVISIKDIVQEDVGRSDQDTVNLIELYSDGVFGKHMKFLTQDAQPIVNPISIARNGLRVRTYNTKFARFSKKHQGSKGGVDNFSTRRKLIRWVLMLDHWYQHNVEYLNGNMTLRAFPEIRVGQRLDIYERRESYYIESVTQSWSYPNPLLTTVTLSRGQRNDPFPVYEKPALRAFGDTPTPEFLYRRDTSRLAQYFRQADPQAVARAFTAEANHHSAQEAYVDWDSNYADIPEANTSTWGNRKASYIAAGAADSARASELRRNIVRAGISGGKSMINLLRQGISSFQNIDELSEIMERPLAKVPLSDDFSIDKVIAETPVGTKGGGKVH